MVSRGKIVIIKKINSHTVPHNDIWTKFAQGIQNLTTSAPPNLFGPKPHDFDNHWDHFCNFVMNTSLVEDKIAKMVPVVGKFMCFWSKTKCWCTTGPILDTLCGFGPYGCIFLCFWSTSHLK